MQSNLNFAHSETTEAGAKSIRTTIRIQTLCCRSPMEILQLAGLRRRVERRSMNRRRAGHEALPPGSPPPQPPSKRERVPVVSTTKRGPRRQPMRPCRAPPSNAADVEALETVLRSMFLDQAQPLGGRDIHGAAPSAATSTANKPNTFVQLAQWLREARKAWCPCQCRMFSSRPNLCTHACCCGGSSSAVLATLDVSGQEKTTTPIIRTSVACRGCGLGGASKGMTPLFLCCNPSSLPAQFSGSGFILSS
jgi:hypothetical protein